MKFSKFFIPTTKEAPKDALLPSHQYLIRGGFVNQIGAGIYNYLPLGKIVLDKIRAIVKEEMDNSGASEVQFGFVTPLSLWEESGRAYTMGDELLKFKDRKDTSYVLSPTNEESVVQLVKNTINSYKDLPLNLYQIYTKFRDEARPRFGLIRCREFLMKDSYSFHSSQEDLLREFNIMEETYKRIYTRLGLDFRVVDANSGSIGGSGSKEFMVLANSGEDTIVVCKECDYGANIEAAIRQKREISKVDSTIDESEMTKVETLNVKTIEEVSIFFKKSKSQIIKAVIKKAIYEDKNEIVVFFVRGDDELEPTKALSCIGALELEDVSLEEIQNSGITQGYCGPFNLPKDITYIVDKELQDEAFLVCGANEESYHYRDADLSTLKDVKYCDLICVQEGDICSSCAGELYHTKGIEVGHIFQLGTKYSVAMDATFLDENGKSKPFIMGCYGIGVSRLMAAVIEQNHDDKGCMWTKETTPFVVDIIVSNAKNEEELNIGNRLYEEIKQEGIATILDDRKNVRFGFKIKDYELLGFPYAIIIGKKLNDGLVEIVDRKSLNKTEVLLTDVKKEILKCINIV